MRIHQLFSRQGEIFHSFTTVLHMRKMSKKLRKQEKIEVWRFLIQLTRQLMIPTAFLLLAFFLFKYDQSLVKIFPS